MGLHLLNHSNEDNTILKSSNYKKSIHNTRHHIPNKKLEYRKTGEEIMKMGGWAKEQINIGNQGGEIQQKFSSSYTY